MAPAKTPPAIVQRLHDAVIKGIAKPDVKEKFAGIGIDVAPMGSAELGKFIQSEIALWAKLVKLAGIQPE
jgi:tripartite-type tricarboxylate transporter receptor subunit TctC